jgi:CRISPR/Cas system-associated exonuclease Cas4 (RecB family)
VSEEKDYDRVFLRFLLSAFRDKYRLLDEESFEGMLLDLLRLEKHRLGYGENRLVFVGMANIADYYWCSVKSVLKSRRDELMFFASYLYDRITYSVRLGLVSKEPTSVDKLLQIGDGIGFSDVEKLLEEEVEKFRTATGKGGSGREILLCPKVEELDAKRRGEVLQELLAEKYPTIRWNFKWSNYIVVNVPDGITKDFVYEFKTTSSRFLYNYIKPVALAQADLYGYFFRRQRKRVQIHIVEEKQTETFESNVDVNNALHVLDSFRKVDEGQEPKPPKEWKCRSCEFKDACPLYTHKFK